MNIHRTCYAYSLSPRLFGLVRRSLLRVVFFAMIYRRYNVMFWTRKTWDRASSIDSSAWPRLNLGVSFPLFVLLIVFIVIRAILRSVRLSRNTCITRFASVIVKLVTWYTLDSFVVGLLALLYVFIADYDDYPSRCVVVSDYMSQICFKLALNIRRS